MLDHLLGALPQLRVHPTAKRLRAEVGEATVLDTTSAVLVWEPRRVVPSYAVPVRDVKGELVAFTGDAGVERPVSMLQGPPVLDPSTPFTVHSSPGSPLTLRTTWGALEGAAFAADDPDLQGYVVLDWAAFTRWLEEDEEVMGHPRDPFHRIDCVRSSRHVEVSLAGVVLADTRRPTLLFETGLPTRYYVPREDVAAETLVPSDHTSVCAYKGRATYDSVRAGNRVAPDLVWRYEEPLHDALPVRDLLCFFNEKVDLRIDGQQATRPLTPWS